MGLFNDYSPKRPKRICDYQSSYDYWFLELVYEFDGNMERLKVVNGKLCSFELGEWAPFSTHVQHEYQAWLAKELLR